MDDEDFLAVISVLQAELRGIGAGDLADERAYMTRDGEDGEMRRLPPKELLIEMLRAFDRYLAVRDRATYDQALERIGTRVRGGRPHEATVLPVNPDGPEIELGAVPHLGGLRSDLRNLIGQLLEAPPPGGLA
jgi:hypothetical protein